MIRPPKCPKPFICKDTCLFKCSENFTQNDRRQIFSGFWDIQDYRGQNNFLINNVDKISKKRKYTKNVNSQRSNSMEYHLNNNNKKKKSVQTFFLSTLDISEKKVFNALKHVTEVGSAIDDKRGKHTPANKTNENIISSAFNFISNLPAVPSHYCRASSSRRYLPADIGNLSKLYKIYLEHCTSQKCMPAGEKVFKDIFRKKFNIGFHIPKKDKCVTCEQYKNNPES